MSRRNGEKRKNPNEKLRLDWAALLLGSKSKQLVFMCAICNIASLPLRMGSLDCQKSYSPLQLTTVQAARAKEVGTRYYRTLIIPSKGFTVAIPIGYQVAVSMIEASLTYWYQARE